MEAAGGEGTSAVVAQLLEAWDISRPATVVPAAHGTNNATWLVRTPRSSYVLRLYQNTADAARITYEHELLRRVSRTALPFAVPVPIAARSGATLVPAPSPEPSAFPARRPPSTPAGSGADAAPAAALFSRIPGERPARSAATAALCGAALAQLDNALSEITDLGAPSLAKYGDLERIHPLVTDPQTLPRALSLASAEAAQLRRSIAAAVEQVPELYQHLPKQVIHSDFTLGNALVSHGRLTGILDFEFAAPDLRAMDWAVGLLHTALLGVPTGQVWEVLEAFGQAYARHLILLPIEIRALPALIRLRQVVSVIHRVGRWRQGLATESAVLDSAAQALETDSWLRTNGDRLVDAALGWHASR